MYHSCSVGRWGFLRRGHSLARLMCEVWLSWRYASPDGKFQLAVKTICHFLQVIAKAADLIADGDVVNRQVRQKQNWALMPFGAVIGSVAPGVYMRGIRETFNIFPGEPNFPRCSLECTRPLCVIPAGVAGGTHSAPLSIEAPHQKPAGPNFRNPAKVYANYLHVSSPG